MLTGTVCMALSAAGLAIALVTAWRHRYRAAVRWTAVALLPTGLYLTGLITVFRRIGGAVGNWAAHLVLDPRVWVGVGMLAGAVVLLLLTGVRTRRSQREPAVTAPARGTAAAHGSAGAPPAVRGGRTGGAAAGGTGADDDMREIEEILKRRGI